jgi:ATP-binding cassette subfamily B protein
VQQIFDQALFPTDGTGVDVGLLWRLVGAMIGLFLLSAVLGVAQTWLTSTVGNAVTGDLRVRLFDHLQAMELGFFTRTKTGVIQSRLQNDVGGVSGVLTNTVTSILGNTVTVISALVAMVLIDWRLTIIAVVLMPILVFVQRRVGQVRARIAGHRRSLSELTSITQETLSVSGILLSKANRQRTESARYREENTNQVRLQVQRAMSGQGFFAVVQVLMASVPAVIYLVSGYLIGCGPPRSPPAPSSRSRPCRRAAAAHGTHAGRPRSADVAGTVRPHLRVPRLVPAIQDARTRPPWPRRRTGRRIEFQRRLPLPGCRGGGASDARRRVLRRRAGRARRLRGALRRRQDDRAVPRAAVLRGLRGRVLFSGADVKTLTQESIIDHIGIVSQETYLFHATIRENLRYAKPDATDAEIEAACEREHPPHHHSVREGLRHRRRGAWLPPLGR